VQLLDGVRDEVRPVAPPRGYAGVVDVDGHRSDPRRNCR
jgi:hypothetical protein